jgi:thioredoxin reductase (NADPH)
MPEKSIDLAVVGAGPAGITAALYAKRKALKVRIFDSEAAGGQTSLAVWVENYPGLGRIKGFDLMQKMAKHLEEFGVEIEEAAEVTGIEKKGKLFEVDINNGEEKVEAKAVILATGSKYKVLDVPGEKELYGKGISYCATCDGLAFKGKTVAVVGAGNSGANAALFFADICKKVFLIEWAEKPNFDEIYKKPLEEAKVEMLFGTAVAAIEGKKKVSGLRLKPAKGGNGESLAVDGVFVYIGMQPKNSLAKKLGLKLDKKGYVEVNERKETGLPGLFVAGDITGEQAQTIVAAGSGAIAATSSFEFVKGLK